LADNNHSSTQQEKLC